jgi:hypothetical protein
LDPKRPACLIYFLPWLLLFPFARFSKLQEQNEQRLARALSWGIAVPFLAVNLVPAARPVQHAGNSSSIVATRHDLRRQRVAMAATLDEDERVWTKVVPRSLGWDL